MKLRKNKKAFTMVELLATLLIIGILSSIGIVSIIKFRQHQRDVFNNAQNKMFVEIAKSYIKDNQNLLPKLPLSSEYITLKELKENNYIDDNFVDYDKNMFSNDSRVTVTRLGNGIYGYRGSLLTTSGNTYNTEKAQLKIEYTYKNKANNLSTINNKHYTNNTPIMNIEINSTNGIKIGAFTYTIYKNGVLYKQSEAYYMNLTNKYSNSITLDDKDYTDASYKIKISVYDENGYKISKNGEEIILDRKSPKCSFSSDSMLEVTVGNRLTMNLTCTDKDSSIDDSTKNLTLSDFGVSSSVATLASISSPIKITNGYRYDIIVSGVSYGDFNIYLKSGTIKDNAGNAVLKTVSEQIKSYNKAIAGTCNQITYNGSAQTLASGGVGITFSNNSGINAGTYTVTMTANSDYRFSNNSSSKTLSCTIDKAASSTSCINNLVYNGSSQTIATGSGCSSLSNSTRTAAGSQQVTCIGDSNHNNSSNTCSIAKADSSVTCQNKTYNGSSQTIATGSGCTLSNQNQMNAGNYTVSCTGDSNHNNSNNTCSIAKADSSVTCQNKTYNGNSQTIATGSGCTLSNQNQINAGNYTVSCTGDSNHNNSNNTCSIAKANSSVTCQNKTYNGNNQTIAKTNGGCTLSGQVKKNAGDYKVSCTGDSNHNDSSATCTISKATPTLTLSKSSLTVKTCSTGATSATFTEKANKNGSFKNTITANATRSPGSYSSVNANTEKTVTITGKTKGSATVTVEFTPDSSNYKSVTKTLNVTINTGTYSSSSTCGTYTCSSYHGKTAEACSKAGGTVVAESECNLHGIFNNGADLCCKTSTTCNNTCCH